MPEIQIMKRSRKPPMPGDIFVLKLSEVGFLFGKVVLANIERGRAPIPGSCLVHIFDRIEKELPPVSASPLSLGNLLIPPIYVYRSAWAQGIFQMVDYSPAEGEGYFGAHCFKDHGGVFRDENGSPTAYSEPCGTWGMASLGFLESKLCQALGIPRTVVD